MEMESKGHVVVDEELALIKLAISNYQKRNNVPDSKILQIIGQVLRGEEEIMVPLSIFNKRLGVLESVVKYLKENLGLRNSRIAKLMNRDDRTIWATYNNSKKKHEEKFQDSEAVVPISVFSERMFGALESLSIFMRDEMSMTFTAIGASLERSPRTIWTSYSKGMKKKHETA